MALKTDCRALDLSLGNKLGLRGLLVAQKADGAGLKKAVLIISSQVPMKWLGRCCNLA